MDQRVKGLDLARALAILGMVIVNFKVAMGAEQGNQVLISLAALFEGRASALFVILAGIGISLLTNRLRLSGSSTDQRQARSTIVKRGLLLLFVGLLFTPIWEADILHFYGCYFLIAAWLITRSDQAILWSGAAIVALFPALMLVIDYESNWDWETLRYENLWTVEGMLRHILFNGFHPVIPWSAFLLLGMWLGRLNLNCTRIRAMLLRTSLVVFVATELAFYLLREVIGANIQGLSTDDINFLLSTDIIPPMPQYLISAASSAVFMLVLCLYLCDHFTHSRLLYWLRQAGKMALTLYVAHVVVGMGILDELGMLERQTIAASLISAGVFFIGGVLFSVLWLKRYRSGPLEWLFRRVAG